MTDLLELAARVRQRIAVTAGGCWEWQGSRNQSGYGQIWRNNEKRCVLTHRVMVLASGRVISEGMQVDHLCRNRACCNPDHLEVVTPKENSRRGIMPEVMRARAALITHCPRGHEYSPANTYTHRRKRYCRTCMDARQKDRRAAQKEARA